MGAKHCPHRSAMMTLKMRRARLSNWRRASCSSSPRLHTSTRNGPMPWQIFRIFSTTSSVTQLRHENFGHSSKKLTGPLTRLHIMHHAACNSCSGVPPPRPRILQKVREQLMAVFGEDRLGMELDARQWILTMTKPHHRAVIGPRRDLEVGRQILAIYDEGVIAGGRKRTGDAPEDRLLRVRDARHLAMHHLRCAADRSAEGLTQALMPQAYAQDGKRGAELDEKVLADARV